MSTVVRRNVSHLTITGPIAEWDALIEYCMDWGYVILGSDPPMVSYDDEQDPPTFTIEAEKIEETTYSQ